MKLEKAKEIADINIKEAGKKMPPDVKDALIILSEAAERILKGRRIYDEYYASLLPSETLD